MTSMPASRSARAMIFAPRSWPSRPGLATTTRILRVLGGADIAPDRSWTRAGRRSARDAQGHPHGRLVDAADDPVAAGAGHPLAVGPVLLERGAEVHRPVGHDVVQVAPHPVPAHG